MAKNKRSKAKTINERYLKDSYLEEEGSSFKEAARKELEGWRQGEEEKG